MYNTKRPLTKIKALSADDACYDLMAWCVFLFSKKRRFKKYGEGSAIKKNLAKKK